MRDPYSVSADGNGKFSIYKNKDLIAFNLDCIDVKSLVAEQQNLASGDIKKCNTYVENNGISGANTAIKAGRPGRKLILEPYVHLIKSMVEQDLGVTARDIERRLRNLGIKFSATTAVTNLARKHDIKLAA